MGNFNLSIKRPNGAAGNALRFPWVTPAPKIPVPLYNSYGSYTPQRPSQGPLGSKLQSYSNFNDAPVSSQTSFRSVVEGSQRVTF